MSRGVKLKAQCIMLQGQSDVNRYQPKPAQKGAQYWTGAALKTGK